MRVNMRILIAIDGKKKTDTLVWAARAGFNLRVFTDPKKLADWERKVMELNNDHYLDLPLSVVETGDPLEFAKHNGFDLLVLLPSNLKKWDKTDSEDGTVYHYQKDIGIARSKFGQDPEMLETTFENGAKIIRV